MGELSGSPEETSVSSRGFVDNLINDLKVGVNNKLMKFTYHTKLWDVVNTADGTKLVRRDQAILETRRYEQNEIQFGKRLSNNIWRKRSQNIAME